MIEKRIFTRFLRYVRLINENLKSEDELENAVDEALNALLLNVIQVCIKKTQKIYQQFVPSYEIA